jgi:hypothetical protein
MAQVDARCGRPGVRDRWRRVLGLEFQPGRRNEYGKQPRAEYCGSGLEQYTTRCPHVSDESGPGSGTTSNTGAASPQGRHAGYSYP